MDQLFDILQETFEAYKRKTYAELDQLPDTSELDDPRLPENSKTIRVTKTWQPEGKLKITLDWQLWISKEEYRKSQEEIWQQCLESLKDDQDLSERQHAKSKRQFEQYLASAEDVPAHLRHPDNENLVASIAYQKEFEILPNGEIIEDEFTRSMKAEEEIIEQADWIGTTGLGEEAERELPKYLRLEYGESILDEDSLKASDLEYLGVFALDAEAIQSDAFSDDAIRIHVWKIPGSDDEPMYGYIEECTSDLCYGMGDYLPRNKL